MTKLTIIRGLPGSGKSTLAKKLAAEQGAVHCEADMYFMNNGQYVFAPSKLRHAHKWCQDFAESNLRAGNNVIVSNTFTQKWEMKAYIDAAQSTGAEVEIITATGNYGSIHDVPTASIERMRDRWED